MASKFGLRASLIKCGGCGKRYSNPLAHTCVPRAGRKRRRTRLTVKVAPSMRCGSCGKQVASLFTHTCKKKSDFKARKKAAVRLAAAERRDANRHDYAGCEDPFCGRYPCTVYREGFEAGQSVPAEG